MCGIVGYVGHRKRCIKALMEGLRRLQYRSYDSGLALQTPRPQLARVPVLELMASWAQRKTDHDWAVPWPCSTEQLQQRIEEEGS